MEQCLSRTKRKWQHGDVSAMQHLRFQVAVTGESKFDTRANVNDEP